MATPQASRPIGSGAVASAGVSAGGGLIGSIVGGLIGINQAKINRKWQAEQNQLDRDFNSLEAQKARDFEEYIYRTYQSPEALKQAYLNAGMNPYMALGSTQPESPISASGASHSSTGASGTMPHIPDFASALSGPLSELGRLILEQANVSSLVRTRSSEAGFHDAAAGNQSAQAAQTTQQTEFLPAQHDSAMKLEAAQTRYFDASEAKMTIDSYAQYLELPWITPMKSQQLALLCADLVALYQGIEESGSRIKVNLSQVRLNDAMASYYTEEAQLIAEQALALLPEAQRGAALGSVQESRMNELLKLMSWVLDVDIESTALQKTFQTPIAKANYEKLLHEVKNIRDEHVQRLTEHFLDGMFNVASGLVPRTSVSTVNSRSLHRGINTNVNSNTVDVTHTHYDLRR